MACARMSALAKALVVAVVAIAAVAQLAAAKNHTIQWSASGNYGDWSASNAVSVGDTVGELTNERITALAVFAPVLALLCICI